MKSFLTFLKEENLCSENSKFIWSGAVKKTVLCNFRDGVAWQGATQSSPLFNIKGNVLWEGSIQSKAIGNFQGGVLWKDQIKETAICNISGNTVWQGATQSRAIGNYGVQVDQVNTCGNESLFLWKDLVRSMPVFNSNTKLGNQHKLALVYWFLVRNKSVNKKAASAVKPKAAVSKPKSKSTQASKA